MSIVRFANFFPPSEVFPSDLFPTDRMFGIKEFSSMATNLYTKPADAAPDPVTNLCPDSKASIGASSRLRILYSSKSPETIICASGAPSLSRSALADFDPAARSPESIRIPFKLAFEAFTALTMPASISYVSTRKIESSPKYLA